jgi:inosine-uridine nucleoside N-ribohydrolase
MVVSRLEPHLENKKIPVILDTDIGGDIDDTWALTMMLKSPELDVRLVVTDTGNTTYRAKISAKMLEIARRTDIPIGIGLHLSDKTGPQAPWVEGYDLSSYTGTVHQDGVTALIDTITASTEPITLICIGPVPNISEALRREPNIAKQSRFVGMCGCIRKSPKGYGGGSGGAVPEYNVAAYPKAYQKVFAEPWDITITPLDTCGFVTLKGEKYRAVRNCRDPVVQAMIENYRIWSRSLNHPEQFEVRSSTLFDTVAIYLAFSQELLVMEKLGIQVTDDGYTTIDPKAKATNCATDWKNLTAFEDLLVKQLTDSQIQ